MQNNNGVHHYLYDANGQRIMKGSMRRNGAVLDGAGDGGQNSFTADPYTVYVNPYYIVTHYSNYAEVTKHYYNGTARLAAQLEGDYDYLDEVQPLEGAFNPVEEDGKALLNDLNLVEGTDYSSAAIYEVEATYPLVVMSQAEFNSAVTGLWGELPPASTMPCHISLYWPFANNGVNCNGAGVMYFYHPDYLGHTEYITDHNGEGYQYFHYSPFGEALVENKSNLGTHTDYFRFNGKELDPETGNYYYGARYYDPTISIWLSVDPMAMHPRQMDKSPYAFSWNNPLRYVDPDGRCPECEENVKDPTEGQTYESSGGQLYKYQNTYDEDGNKTGTEWTALGGTLAEVEVGPGADNSGDEEQRGGLTKETVGGISVVGGMVSHLEESYKRGSNKANYSQRVNGKVRNPQVLTRANSIHASKMVKGLKLLGKGVSAVGVGAAFYEFGNSDKSGADQARLAGSLIITGTAFIPFVGPIISIGLGAADASGAFDDIYEKFED